MPLSPVLRVFLLCLEVAPAAHAQNALVLQDRGKETDDRYWTDLSLLYKRNREGDRERRLRGAKAFPAYEAILADKKSTAHEVYMIFATLLDLKKTDRRRFVKYAVRGLKGHDAVARGIARFKGVPDQDRIDRWKSDDQSVRQNAVELLEEIGTEKEAAAVFALASDPDEYIRFCAVKATAAIGGRAESRGLNRILATTNPTRDNKDWLDHVEKYRDAMKKRLDALDKAKGVVQPEP